MTRIKKIEKESVGIEGPSDHSKRTLSYVGLAARYASVLSLLFLSAAASAQDQSLSQSNALNSPMSNIDAAVQRSEATPLANFTVASSWTASRSESLFIWQGFDHEWKRFVVLKNEGRVPHRLSKFQNYLAETEAGDVVAHVGQSTGVDGNYAKPKVYYSEIKNGSDAFTIHKGITSFSWFDEVNNAEHPVANNKIVQPIPLPEHSVEPNAPYVVLLDGFELDLQCEDSDQPESEPCNSNGIWPYIFQIQLQGCSSMVGEEFSEQVVRTEYEQTQSDDVRSGCRIEANIFRAWTPNKGGFQLWPIINEVKPLNHRLNYKLNIRYSYISGDNLQVSPALLHESSFKLQAKTSPVDTTVDEAFDRQMHVTGITGFGFMLEEPEAINPAWQWLGSDVLHRGRYLGHLGFSVVNPENGYTPVFQQQLQVWSPISVVDSHVVATLNTQLLSINQAVQQNVAKGKICINSTEQAPAFSRWTMCGLNNPIARWIYGAAQSEDSMPIGEGQ